MASVHVAVNSQRRQMNAIRRALPEDSGRKMSGRQWVKLRKALQRQRRKR